MPSVSCLRDKKWIWLEIDFCTFFIKLETLSLLNLLDGIGAIVPSSSTPIRTIIDSTELNFLSKYPEILSIISLSLPVKKSRALNSKCTFNSLFSNFVNRSLKWISCSSLLQKILKNLLIGFFYCFHIKF